MEAKIQFIYIRSFWLLGAGASCCQKEGQSQLPLQSRKQKSRLSFEKNTLKKAKSSKNEESELNYLSFQENKNKEPTMQFTQEQTKATYQESSANDTEKLSDKNFNREYYSGDSNPLSSQNQNIESKGKDQSQRQSKLTEQEIKKIFQILTQFEKQKSYKKLEKALTKLDQEGNGLIKVDE